MTMYTTSYRKQLVSGNLLAAHYPLLSSLNNSIPSGATSATYLSSVAKNHVAADGTISVKGVNTPAYMSSGIQLENLSQDFMLDDDFGGTWADPYYASESRVTDPIGGTDALHIVSNATSNIDLNRFYTDGFSGLSYFSVYAKSSTGWFKITVADSIATNHGASVWINLSGNTYGTITTYGTLFSISAPVVSNAPNGFKRIQFQMTNSSNNDLQIDFYNVTGNGSNAYTPGDTITVWNPDGMSNATDSLVYSPGGSGVQSKDYLYIPTTRLPTTNFSTYFEWAFKYASLGTLAYVYFEGNAAFGATTNETSVTYNKTSHDWTLTVKRGGVTQTAVVNYAISLTYLIKVFFKISANAIYLEIDGNSATGTGVGIAYRATNIWMNAGGESLFTDFAPTGTLANFRVARTTQLTRTEVEAL